MKVLVTGYSGTGKSTVCKELIKRGMVAFDSDKVPGLAYWQNKHTNQRVTVDVNAPIDFSRVDWVWNAETIEQLLNKQPDVFICGSAHAILSFSDLFDKVIVLSLSPSEQTRRILMRTDSSYGKHPDVLSSTLKGQQELELLAAASGAIIIDASPAVNIVVDKVIAITHDA